MKYTYQAYGIAISSEIELKALFPTNNITENAVNVSVGNVPNALKNTPLQEKPFTTFNENEFIYRLPNIANYYVTDGNNIIIEPLCEDWNEVLLYFYANCLAAILYQRNLIPFHVSGIFVEENATRKVLLFAAPSRTGKSTTAVMMQQRGYAPFCDDTALLSVENGKCFAQASYPMIRLWQNSIDQQNVLNETGMHSIMGENIDKFAFYFHEQFSTEKVEIAGIVFLEEAGDAITIKNITPANTMQLLGNNIYRGEWISHMKKGKLQFEMLQKLAKIMPAHKAIRPKGVNSFEAFAEVIDAEIMGANVMV